MGSKISMKIEWVTIKMISWIESSTPTANTSSIKALARNTTIENGHLEAWRLRKTEPNIKENGTKKTMSSTAKEL